MRNLFLSLILIGCSVGEPPASSSSIEDIRATTDSALCLLEEMGKAKVDALAIDSVSFPSIEKDRGVYHAVVSVKADTVFIYRVDTVYIER